MSSQDACAGFVVESSEDNLNNASLVGNSTVSGPPSGRPSATEVPEKGLQKDKPILLGESVCEKDELKADELKEPLTRSSRSDLFVGLSQRKRSMRMRIDQSVNRMKSAGHTIWTHPQILIIPLILLCVMVGLGTWGVLAAADNERDNNRSDAIALGIDVATGFELQLKETFTPGITLATMVEQNASWDFWEPRFRRIVDELMLQVVPGSLYNIQFQPLGQVRIIQPLRPSDRSQIGKDLLNDRERRPQSLSVIASKQRGISVVYLSPQNFTAAFVRVPIFLRNVSANNTHDYWFPGANYTRPEYPEDVFYPPITEGSFPLGYQTCDICYVAANATEPSSQWWGFITLTVNFQAVVEGADSRFARLYEDGYNYALTRPLNATHTRPIVESQGFNYGNAVTVNVTVPSQVWVLHIETKWDPSWTGAVIAAVVIISFIISGLSFISLLYYYQQKGMLTSTINANRELEKTTIALEAEKVRLDALLVRQYGLLACLDMKALAKNSDAVEAQTGLTLDRIELARRQVNEASTKPGANKLDQIEIHELLGEGSFGKVNKGVWRGTIVAVKTMHLPANMPGSEKREKMAVMEAAISSSLIHPNIVTTYTYSIRECLDSGSVTPSPGAGFTDLGSLIQRDTADGSQTTIRADTAESQGTIESCDSGSNVRSYEVRMVLEYCDKGSLWEALEQGAFLTESGGLNMTAIVETMADIASAMVHMHAASILHSDLKARNIMLKSNGLQGRGVIAKVADFGLSTQMSHQETHVSSMFQGTLTHMAPEILMDGRISKAGDVYSFGITMWEVFTASKPFTEVPRSHLGYAITKQNLRPTWPIFAPKAYVELGNKCWDADPAVRPTFEVIANELQAILKTLPAVAAPLVIVPPKVETKTKISTVNLGSSGSQVMRTPPPWGALTPVPEADVKEEAALTEEG